MSIFGNPDIPFKTRVSLLEERLSSYDEISKQMLSKLEQAVEKISESTRNTSQILIRHEERIDRASEANAALIQLISRTETELKGDISKTLEEIKSQSKDIDDLKKSKWVWLGIIAASSLFLGQLKMGDYIHIRDNQLPNAEHTRSL